MTDWPHAPIHRFEGANTFFITGGTYLKQHFYRAVAALDSLQQLLFAKAKEHACWLQAWALLSNHYHVKGRRVWYQFWDKALTFERSWLARLRYTNENAVHHGIVKTATDYKWCSASWFELNAPRRFVETVRRIRIDSVKVYDPF